MQKIREATLQDFESINYLSQFLGYKKLSDELAKIRLQNLLSSINDKIWVFEEENSITGWLHIFIAYRVASAQFAEIGGLVVGLDCRRLGIGRALVQHAYNWAKVHGLNLRVRCNSKRQGVYEFYNSMNFQHKKTQYVLEKNI